MRRQTKLWAITGLVLIMVVSALGLSLSGTKNAEAAGTASFSISPSSGTYTVGDTINVSISVTASPSDNANAAQVNLTFPSSLTWQNTTITGPFTICPQNSHSATTVSVACAASSAQSGTQPVITVSFKVASAGSATVAMASGSSVASTSGANVFNGVLPSASYTLSSGSTPTPPPTSPPSSPSSPSSPSNSAKPKTNTPASPSGNTTSPTTSPTPATSTPAPTDDKSTGSFSVTIKDSTGKRVKDALVKLDERSAKTDDNGVANFSGVSKGEYALYVTAPGKQPFSATVTVGAGENKLATYTLTTAESASGWVVWAAAIGSLILLGTGGALLYWKLRHRKQIPADWYPPQAS